eukprot:scaffold26495_cov103-Cylindrotheca_fusiformis.AAC.3
METLFEEETGTTTILPIQCTRSCTINSSPTEARLRSFLAPLVDGTQEAPTGDALEQLGAFFTRVRARNSPNHHATRYSLMSFEEGIGMRTPILLYYRPYAKKVRHHHDPGSSVTDILIIDGALYVQYSRGHLHL